MLTFNQALDIVQELEAVPFATDERIRAAARALVIWCRPQFAAGRMWKAEDLATDTVHRFKFHHEYGKKWPGLPGLLEVFSERFIPGDDPRFEERVKARREAAERAKLAEAASRPDPADCTLCDGNGVILDPETKLWGWCACKYGSTLRVDVPNYLELVNSNILERRKLFPSQLGPRRMTSPEFARAVGAKMPRAPKRKRVSE